MAEDSIDEVAQLATEISALCGGHKKSIALLAVLVVAHADLEDILEARPPEAVALVFAALRDHITEHIDSGVFVRTMPTARPM